MEKEIIQKAIEKLKQTTGIKAVYKSTKTLDGEIKFTLNNVTFEFNVEIKQELRMHQIPQIENYFINNTNFLLVANRIFPKIKKILQEKNIPYLEGNGNIYLKKDGVFLFIDTQEPLEISKNMGNRAFTKTGLKVLFYLLQHKEAVNLPQRELAELTNVALGNIPLILDGLKETGYLIPLNNKKYIWENRNLLLERWINEYASILKPKLFKEKYMLKTNWKEIKFKIHTTVWGAEPAADIITNYLRPEKYVLYTQETRMELIKNYKLMPDKNGEIEVFEMFWKENKDKTAPPLLVYADLILEGGKRNKETAEKIYNEHIKPKL